MLAKIELIVIENTRDLEIGALVKPEASMAAIVFWMQVVLGRRSSRYLCFQCGYRVSRHIVQVPFPH